MTKINALHICQCKVSYAEMSSSRDITAIWGYGRHSSDAWVPNEDLAMLHDLVLPY